MNSSLWMLDTNTVSDLIRQKDSSIVDQLSSRDINNICISVVTEAELLYGLAKRPEAKQLRKLVEAFLVRVSALPWNSRVAEHYAQLRAAVETKGQSLSNLDMMIAAHALAVQATLVTSDNAFHCVDDMLDLENWRC